MEIKNPTFTILLCILCTLQLYAWLMSQGDSLNFYRCQGCMHVSLVKYMLYNHRVVISSPEISMLCPPEARHFTLICSF